MSIYWANATTSQPAASSRCGALCWAVPEPRFAGWSARATPSDPRRDRIPSFDRPQQSLDELRHRAPLGLLATRGAFGVDPVHLKRPTLSSTRLEAMERALIASECEQRSAAGLDLDGVVVNVPLRAEDPQPPALLVPAGVEIDEN